MRDIAACADQIRGNAPGSPPAGARTYAVDPICPEVAGTVTGNTAPSHYIDIPVPTHEKDLQEFCPNGACIVDQIERFEKVMRESADDGERRRALLFLVHFVGDIHQTLHASERACDQGGNRELVNFYLGRDERANDHLHRVWDSGLVDKYMRDANLPDEQALPSDLESRIDEDAAVRWARASTRQMAICGRQQYVTRWQQRLLCKNNSISHGVLIQLADRDVGDVAGIDLCDAGL